MKLLLILAAVKRQDQNYNQAEEEGCFRNDFTEGFPIMPRVSFGVHTDKT
jgi:hypothetical protein